MSRSLAERLEAAWLRLPHDLERERLERLFTPALPGAALDRMLASPRLAERLADRVAAHLGLARPHVDDFVDPGAEIALAGRAVMDQAIRLAGPIRHRDRLRPLVLRNVRAEVAAAIGADAFAAALACPPGGEPAAGDAGAGDLISACQRDGVVCVACWVRQLPANLSGWIRALTPILDDIGIPDYPDRAMVLAGGLAAAAALGRTP